VTQDSIFDKILCLYSISYLQPCPARLICVAMRYFGFYLALLLTVSGVVFTALPVRAQNIAQAASEMPMPYPVEADETCPARPLDTVIHIKLQMPEPKIDHTQSRYDLRDFNVSTKSPYGEGKFTHVNGLMRGPVELSTKMTIAWQTNSQQKESCFWYRTVTLTLKLKPVIYIAKEVVADTCYFDAIIAHEMKHVEVDRGLIRDYQNIIYDSIENFIQENGTIDNVSLGQEKTAQKQLSQQLEEQIRDLHKRMRQERIERQAQVDNLTEYNQVASQCDLKERIDQDLEQITRNKKQ
jgi:hypothetical protein